MIKLTQKEIKEILPRIQTGLDSYLSIQELIWSVDVSKDEVFQRKFNNFYRVTPFRNKEWQKHYYTIFQLAKNKKFTFGEILHKIKEKTGTLEASFASKLIASIEIQLPVIDSIVLKNLGLRLPSQKSEDRELKVIALHGLLTNLFNEYLKTHNGKYLTTEFKKMYPNAHISRQKMLDLILWQKR